MKIISEAVIKTENEGYGFHSIGGQFASMGADLAYDALAQAFVQKGLPKEKTVEFLDSKLGRHLADAIPVARLEGNPKKIADEAFQILKHWTSSASMNKEFKTYGVLDIIKR